MRKANPEYPVYLNQTLFTTLGDIAEVFGTPAAFDAQRSGDWVLKNRHRWFEPPCPNDQARRWYRAATTLDALDHKTVDDYRKMIILFEAAARAGWYRAVKALINVYQEGRLVRGGRFKPNLKKKRAWIYYGLEQRWAGALEWVANAGIPDALKLMYLQQAADFGVASAQFQLARVYEFRRHMPETKDALLQCAADQENGDALYELGLTAQVEGNEQESDHFFQRAVMVGGESGGDAAYNLSFRFLGHDATREKAYRAIADALLGSESVDGNPYLSFPRLNEVLPLPPGKTNWGRLEEAMNPDDAVYYQNPMDADTLIAEVEQAGYRIDGTYDDQPVFLQPAPSV